MLLFAGDPHGSLDYIYPFLDKYADLSIIILGDLALESSKELEDLANKCDLWFIHGNHDSYSEAHFNALWGSSCSGRNLHGRVVEIQGKKIAGLGGVFRGSIWWPSAKPHYFDPIHYCQYLAQKDIWQGGLPLKHRTSIFPADIEVLSEQTADILICHEAPKPHHCGFQVINQLADQMQIKQIIHGHHHENLDYIGLHNYNYKIISVGFQSILNELGEFILINQEDKK